MFVQYNLSVRRQLKKLMSLQQDASTINLNQISSDLDKLLIEYSDTCEESTKARLEIYNTINRYLNETYNQHVYRHKSFWAKVLYFFGWHPANEKNYFQVLKKVKSLISSVDSTTLDKWLIKRVKSIIRDDPNNIDAQIKYLSHRTLTNIHLTPEKLQGNIFRRAFADYCDDILSFLKNETDIDESTKKIFEDIFAKLHSCLESEDDNLLYNFLMELKKNDQHKESIAAFQHSRIADISFDIINKIAELPVNKSVVFAHGYIGHATLFEVCKIDENHVVFRFINTGNGVNEVESWRTTFINFISNHNRTPIKITSPISLNSLFNADNQGLIAQLVSPKVIDSENPSYQMLKPLISLYNNNQLHDDKKKIKYQVTGTCSQSCIDAWMENKLSEANWLSFKLHRQALTLAKIEKLLQQDSLTPEIRKQCEHMRIAAHLELAIMKKESETMLEKSKKHQDESSETLHALREKKASQKNSQPKIIIDMKQYCQKKIELQRLNKKFSSNECSTILSSSALELQPKKMLISEQTTFVEKFKLFGKKPKSKILTQEALQQVRVNKALLAKSFLAHKQLSNQLQSVISNLPKCNLSAKEQARVDLLVQLKQRNENISYPQLDPDNQESQLDLFLRQLQK